MKYVSQASSETIFPKRKDTYSVVLVIGKRLRVADQFKQVHRISVEVNRDVVQGHGLNSQKVTCCCIVSINFEVVYLGKAFGDDC